MMLSKPLVLAAAFALLAAFYLFAFPAMARLLGGHTPAGGAFDTVFFYTPSQAIHKASLFDGNDIAEFIRGHWTFDLAYPLAYGLFFASAWALGLRLLAGAGEPRYRLVAIPLVTVAFDLCENASVSILLAAYASASGSSGAIVRVAAVAASGSTMLKWLFVLVSLAGALSLPIAGLVASARRRRST